MGSRGFALAVRLPTTTAYWNLRAEQVMDRVFDPDALAPRRTNQPELEAVEVAVHEPPPPPPPPTVRPQAPPAPAVTPQGSNPWLISLLTAVAVAGAVSSGWLLIHWQTSRDQLAQERSLLMIERLRASTPPQPQARKPAQAASTEMLPPPPPEPEWIRELEPQKAALPPLPPDPGPLPQLTGVVQGPGSSSSAIFQIGASSLSAGLGEAIGSSGWILDSVSDAGAVIRRNGRRHSLAVGGVF